MEEDIMIAIDKADLICVIYQELRRQSEVNHFLGFVSDLSDELDVNIDGHVDLDKLADAIIAKGTFTALE